MFINDNIKLAYRFPNTHKLFASNGKQYAINVYYSTSISNRIQTHDTVDIYNCHFQFYVDNKTNSSVMITLFITLVTHGRYLERKRETTLFDVRLARCTRPG